VCLNDIKLESKALRLTGKVQVEASATASGKITFTPLGVVGHTLCFAPFDYNMPQAIGIDTVARLQDSANQIAIESRISNPIHIRFPFRTITEKLAANPKFQVVCPIPGVATKMRVLTPDSWWPKVARGDIDKDFPSFSFNLDLFSKPIDVGGVALTGRLQHTEKGIGGVFTLANAGGARRPR
jgi:hypothetical protein